MKNFFKLLMISVIVMLLGSGNAWATDVELNTTNTDDGVIITSNGDNSSNGERIHIYESSKLIFESSQGIQIVNQASTNTDRAFTRVVSDDDLFLDADADNGGVGTIYLRTQGSTIVSVTSSGMAVTGGIDNNLGGITGAGAISGVTTIGATGLATLNGGIQVDTNNFTVNGTSGAVTTASTMDVDGLATLDGGIQVDTNAFTVNGGNGDLVSNGTASSITGATSLGLTGDNSSVSLSSNSATVGVTGGAEMSATNTQITVLTSDGKGLTVNETTQTTTLTGGQNSSTWTLTDAQATLGVGTAAESEITVFDATNAGTITSVTIGGTSNVSNSILATSANGINNINANAVSGTNNIEGKTTNIGVATTSSVTNIGNTHQMIVDSTSSRFVSNSGTQHIAVNDSGTVVTGAVGHTLTVTSTATTIDGTAAIYAGDGVGNRLFIDGTSTRMVSSDGTQHVAVRDAGTLITAAAGHTLNVTSTTTTVDGSATIYSGDGVGNYITIDTTSARIVSADGNNNLTLKDASANLSVSNNLLTMTAATNAVVLQSDNDASAANARAKLTMAPTSATLLVNTDAGVAHGVDINQTRTVISGGTHSTSLTLNDWGATFQNDTTGGPARVTGVADGEDRYDAVNYGQLEKAYSGVAVACARSHSRSTFREDSYDRERLWLL